MSDIDPTSRTPAADPEALSRVATLVRAATRLANTDAGTDLRSPWLEVVSDCVTAAGYLTDVPDAPWDTEGFDDASSDRTESGLLDALEAAAQALDRAGGRRDHRAVMVRAALTDAIATTRRIQG